MDLCFVLSCFFLVASLFVFFCAFCAKSFRKKEFKTALIASFILLLNLSYYKHEFFNLFQLSQSLVTTCDTIFMKTSQRTNSSSNTYLFCQNMTKIFCQFHKFLIFAFYFEFFSFCV